MFNSDKIKERVRQLMKERFFYDKTDLLSGINLQHKYSISQIYATLTEMIQDDNELIDKYGRTGYLINIDEYYLFQPMELNNERISVFERSVPIDYKHSKIQFELQNDIEKEEIRIDNQVNTQDNTQDSVILEIQKIKEHML